MEKQKERLLRNSQSSLATLDHKNITLVCFCKQQSSKKLSENGESCRPGDLVKTSSLAWKEENIPYCNLPEVTESSGRQVS